MAARPTRRILVFGSTQAGKSSLINELTGLNLKVGTGGRGCTGDTEEVSISRGDVDYEFVDTSGLNEPPTGTVPNVEALTKLITLVKQWKNDSQPIHLIIFVTDLKISTLSTANYKLVAQILTNKSVPLLIVATHSDQDKSPGDWAKNPKNRTAFEESYGTLAPFKELVSTCMAKSADDQEQERIYDRKRKEGKQSVWAAIEKYGQSGHTISSPLQDIITSIIQFFFDLFGIVSSEQRAVGHVLEQSGVDSKDKEAILNKLKELNKK